MKDTSAIFVESPIAFPWPCVTLLVSLPHETDMQPIQLKTWSYSRLGVFEQCKFRAKLQYVDKIPEPARPLPEGKTEHANDRGTRVHEEAEIFVRGGV